METNLIIKKNVVETKLILNGIDLSDKVLRYNLKDEGSGAILDLTIVIDKVNKDDSVSEGE